MVCLPFEDDYHETYSGAALSLSGWGFTTVRNEEKSKGMNILFIIPFVNSESEFYHFQGV